MLGSHDIRHGAWVSQQLLKPPLFQRSGLPFPVHLREQRKPYWGPLGYPEKEKEKKIDYFYAWVSGGSISVSRASSRPGSRQLDLKWSCSEAAARSCGFSININAQGYAMGALQHNLFSLPSDPAHQ